MTPRRRRPGRVLVWLASLMVVGVAGCADRSATAPATTGGLRAAVASDQGIVVPGSYVVTLGGGGAAATALTAQVRALGGTVDLLRSDAGIALISGIPDGSAATIAALPGISDVQPDQVVALPPPLGIQAPTAALAPTSAGAPNTAALYAREWNLPAVHADQAWAAGVLGKSTTHVAIMDSGIDYLWPDLVGRVDLTRSASMLRPVTLRVTDASGTHLVTFSEADTVAKYFPARNPITDLGFHGTMVASVVSSNAQILAGVTSGLSLMAVKVCSYLFCFNSDIVRGVLYAVDHGADVMNFSLGSYYPKAGAAALAHQFAGSFAIGLTYFGFFNALMSFARSKGVTIVVSAGNDGIDLDHDANGFADFCERPGVICVSATGPTSGGPNDTGPFLPSVDQPAVYTNFGRSAIDLAAPGGNFVPDADGNPVTAGWIWMPCSTTSLLFPVCQTGHLIFGSVGTSFVSPHVAAAAALVVERVGRNPALVKARLEQTADQLGASGQDPYYGHGRLNVARAVGVVP